ncbi:MAG: nucleoside deaminase [Actinomycetota bacterium]
MTALDPASMLDVALHEAREGAREGGIPIGAVLFASDGWPLGRGRNRFVQDGDPSLHAETEAVRDAGRRPSYRETVLATTLAPCEACTDLILRTGIGSVVIGESETLSGDMVRLRAAGIRVVDLGSHACVELLGGFIREHLEIWAEA